MPELPEVETIVRELAGVLPGHRIQKVTIRHPKLVGSSKRRFSRDVRGEEVLGVDRRGKNIVISLSRPSFLVVNLGMTGQLLFAGEDDTTPPPTHLALHFSLTNAASLYYADVRRFGLLRVYSPTEWKAESKRLGPEPLGRELSSEAFHRALQASRSPIRSWLLDQRRIAGIGNIYAAEALFLSGIHPRRPARSLAPGESKALLAGIRKVLRNAVRARGTTLRDYRTASGDRGGFATALQVYGRDGERCLNCKAHVVRIVFGNRSAFLCPHCQPEVL
jgi:formamidopyrimidine-DNA glycosylase